MTMQKKLITLGSTLLAAIALTASLSMAQAQPYRHDPDYRHSCRAQIERAEARLDRAIHRHGRDSYEARERRRELRHVRERCDRYDRHHHPY